VTEDVFDLEDGESTTILEASEKDCCDSEEVKLLHRLTDGQLATDCLRVL